MMADVPQPVQHYSVEQLQNLHADSGVYEQHSSGKIRIRAVRDAARSVGMQSGLAYQGAEINKILRARTAYLDRIFNFAFIMYRNNVMPPVLERAENTVNVDYAGQALRAGGVVYRIIKQVQFVTVPPTWRNYLMMNYQPPELPNKVLLPKNSQEREAWQTNVRLGWNEGMSQAVTIFKINLDTLVRDYTGMVLYKKLLMQNMVSPFYVDKSDRGITGDGRKMVVDDQSWRITAQPALQVHSKLWKPVLNFKTQE